VRLFVAADIPPEVRARLAACQARLRGLPLPVRWTRPEGIHLTLFFLGEAPAERLPVIESVVAGVAAAARGFRLLARGVATFPERGRPRVIVVGIAGDLDAAARLKEALDAALGPLGFRADGRPFHPHLTLGRTKDGPAGDWKTPLERERETEAGPFDVQGIALFESRLGPGGSQYRVVREFPLASPDAGGGDGPRERS